VWNLELESEPKSKMRSKKSFRQKMRRRNLILNLTALITASSLTAYAFAFAEAANYDRIKKDISVMIGIVHSSFAGEEVCRRCDIKVSGYYLAHQGVVFNVDPDSSMNVAFGGMRFDRDMSVVVEGLESIPSFVSDIISGVRVEIGDAEFDGVEFVEGNRAWDSESRETRQELREIRSDLAERSRELREIEIESIHADDSDLKELETEEKQVEGQIADLELQERNIRERLKSVIEKRTSESKARTAKREAERQVKFEQIETMVLNTFCDYGNAMRNLPDGERISVIVKRDEERSNIYVFEQEELKKCDSGDGDVRGSALSYAF
jgi:hypothetical protein